jgi:hypothetical protein
MMMTTTTMASLVNSGYVASEQTAKKTPLPTIRLLLSTYLLPGNAFSEPFLSNLGATTVENISLSFEFLLTERNSAQLQKFSGFHTNF